MRINETIKIVKDRTRKRAKGRNARSGRGNKGAKARGRGWMLCGVQSGGQNPFYRAHGKIGFKSPLRPKKKIKLIDASKLYTLKDKAVITLKDLLNLSLISQKDIEKGYRIKVLNLKSLKRDIKINL